MNEQLVVKNFGPFQKEEIGVRFGKITIFIGPTGGGKSTLAKLAAIFQNDKAQKGPVDLSVLTTLGLTSFWRAESQVNWGRYAFEIRNATGEERAQHIVEAGEPDLEGLSIVRQVEIKSWLSENALRESRRAKLELLKSLLEEDQIENQPQFDSEVKWQQIIFRSNTAHYIPSERAFSSAIEYSKDGLMRDDIGLPKSLLDFNNSLALARREMQELDIRFLNVKYLRRSENDLIQVPGVDNPLPLRETASGIQSVTPMMVLLEYLSRNPEQAQSFIVEEPELNLYPTAQQGLLNWLVEKCTKGENDLTITTHSPYILSSCNLLLEAFKVAQQRPELADEVATVVPRESWINPEEFAAYYVADGTVKPITDGRTHLIGSNELDAVSGDISDKFRELLRLQKRKPTAV